MLAPEESPSHRCNHESPINAKMGRCWGPTTESLMLETAQIVKRCLQMMAAVQEEYWRRTEKCGEVSF
jgi:hypothetical protein